jgi:hypothetical protein
LASSGFQTRPHEINAQWIVYDALYAYRQEMIRLGKPNNEFKDAAPV